MQAACFDSFGDGELSAPSEVIIKAKIDKDAIENLTIAEKDLDAALAKKLQDMQSSSGASQAAEEAKQAAAAAQKTANDVVVRVKATQDSVTSIVAKLSGNPQTSGYSAITQIYSGLQLKVDKNGVVSAINVAPGGVRIDGKVLHVTGATQFDNNIIANRMIQARAITADKLSVGSLSAISADIGLLRTKTAGERVEMENNQIRVYDANNKLRVRMGVW